jgi:hypothetical protein
VLLLIVPSIQIPRCGGEITDVRLKAKDLNKKAARLLLKVEGKGECFSFLRLPLPCAYFCSLPSPSTEDFV